MAEMDESHGLSPALAAAATAAVVALRALGDAGDVFRPAAVDAVRTAGLHRLVLPVGRGGFGAGLRASAEVLAAVGAVDGSTALGLAMQTHLLGSAMESGAWPAAALEQLVQAVVRDGALVNSAASEEGSGSPSRGGLPDTRTVRTADGFRISGEKTFTTWLPALRFALVSSRIVDGDADAGVDPSDITVGNLLVDLEAPGVERVDGFAALGMRGSASAVLRLRDVHLGPEALVFARRPAEPDPRGVSAPAWFAMCLAATYLGVGEGARAAVTRWAIDRRPGDGTTAVADLPTVQVRLGRLDATLRAARLVLMAVAEHWDAAAPAERATLLSDVTLAKVTATNAAASATDEALRIAGGPGFVAGPIERAFRDARAGLINPPLDDIAHAGFARSLVERERGRRVG